MNDILNITQGPIFDNSISKFEYHCYSPFLQSFNPSDEIRILIQQQDLCILPSESYIYVEGSLTKADGTVSAGKLTNNAMAFLFEEIQYELNGVNIDNNKNVGITSTLKNYISLNANESKSLENGSWTGGSSFSLASGTFNFCIKLKYLLGFAEDYKKIITNARHELILIRTRSNENAYFSKDNEELKLSIFKLQWRVPHITLSDSNKLTLLKQIQSNPIQIHFRNWEMYEYPTLPTTTDHVWTVKTSSQLEKPRYIIIALQTDRKNQRNKDASIFDHCDVSNVKVHLNSESYPREDLNVKYKLDRYAILYEMYSKFQQSYYQQQSNPLLSRQDFKDIAPILVIDCSHQNESIKTGPVDVKIELKTLTSIPASTTMYCLILHDRIIEYNPLTGEVNKVI
ncbi:uncharacterized protein LOC129950388 [Eupeodes corollae]|uniref:uncharacterized protein LOC129950388 n=1 Tax=Eupeodes corollae TaxID=290404 RepID=UPI00248F6249|nr:uncharacterized protein LOC129950388 [Eupeodes corollae]